MDECGAVGVDDVDKGDIRQIEHINIKELLYVSELQGPLIQIIFDQYDGLLTYTMSLLTMISGTEYETSFKTRLNSILESLGTSTQIILLQQRLLKSIERKSTTEDRINQFKNEFIKKSLENTVEISEIKSIR